MAAQRIFPVRSANGAPKEAVLRLLPPYLEQAQEQAFEAAMRGQQEIGDDNA